VRLRADTWDASLITLPNTSAACTRPTTRPALRRFGIWEERDKDSQNLVAIRSITSRGAPSATSGWTAARIRAGRDAQRDGLLHRQVGQRHSDRHDHAPEGRLDPAATASPRSDRATVTEHFIKHGNR
jgi:hypothetical protein